MRKINFQIIALFIFIILTWGLAWPVNKIGLAYMSPLWYTAMRLVVGTVTMMAFVMLIKKFSWPKREDLPLILLIGILQISLYILLANIGLAYLPAGRSSLIAYTTPLWIMPVTVFLFKEKTSTWKWSGFMLGVLGLILLLSPWDMDWSNRDTFIGTGMLLLASLGWAISILGVRYMRWSKSPLELIPWQLLVGTIPILLLAIIKEPHVTFTWNTPLVLSLFYTGFIVTGISYWSGVVINKSLPALVVSIGFLLVPVLSLIISAFYMHEAISLLTASAMALIISGLMMVAI